MNTYLVRALVVATLTAGFPNAVAAAKTGDTLPRSAIIHGGFVTGNKFRAMEIPEQYAYAMGALDGMLAAPLFGAENHRLFWLAHYTRDMTNEQLCAIIMKYLDENPEKWNQPLNISVFDALKNASTKTARKTSRTKD